MIESRPTVSIFCFCKNARHSIERCVSSVFNQTYPSIQFVIQDGGSTDGTFEYLQSLGDRIDLRSEPETSPQDGFFHALKVCEGDIIGSCLSDEELMPYAVEWAVSNFQLHPNCAAIYGDTYITDKAGVVQRLKQGTPDFSITNYLTFRAHMEFVSIFFQRKFLDTVGLHYRSWLPDTAEYELISRLSLAHDINYIPGVIGKYAYHKNALSQKPSHVHAFTQGMASFIDQLCNEPNVKAHIAPYRNKIFSALYLKSTRTLVSLNQLQDAKKFLKKASRYSPDPMDYYKTKQLLLRKTNPGFNLREFPLFLKHLYNFSLSMISTLKEFLVNFLLNNTLICKTYLAWIRATRQKD